MFMILTETSASGSAPEVSENENLLHPMPPPVGFCPVHVHPCLPVVKNMSRPNLNLSTKPTGQVESLGETFPSDEARRGRFLVVAQENDYYRIRGIAKHKPQRNCSSALEDARQQFPHPQPRVDMGPAKSLADFQHPD